MNYLYTRDLWRLGRQPDLPVPTPEPPPSFDAEQKTDWATAMAILALVTRPDGTRRSEYGINRSAQRQLPERGVDIRFTERVLDAWRIAGLRAGNDLIAAGREEFMGERTHIGVRNEIERMAVTRMKEVDPAVEIIVTGLALVDEAKNPTIPSDVWAVTIQARYGSYAFRVLSQQAPETRWMQDLCIWHTQTA